MSPNFKARLKTSLISISSLFLLISCAHSLSWLITPALAIIVSIALREYSSICLKKNIFISPALLSTAASLFFISRYLALSHPSLFFLPPLTLFLLATTLLLISFHNPTNALSTLSHTLFGFIYIALPLSWIINIHFSSTFWLVWLIATVKGSDIIAYTIGKTIGTHPLAPIISPKKTIEGALAGILGAALISLLLSPLSPTPLPLKNFFFLGCSIGTLAILGDLSESLIKRDANIKDSSSIPGLGGTLDTLDSLLFTTPCLYFYLKLYHLI